MVTEDRSFRWLSDDEQRAWRAYLVASARLHEALSHRTARPADDETTLASLAAASYWGAVSGLVESGLAMLPRAERVMPEER